MALYKFEACNKSTGEMIFEKIFNETFPPEHNYLIGKKFKLMYYLAKKFRMSRSDVGVMCYKHDGKDYVYYPLGQL